MTTWVTPPSKPPKSGIESSEINGRLLVDETEIVVYNDSSVLEQLEGKQSIRAFSSENRPTAELVVGEMIYDTTLQKPLWWNGTIWKDATGTAV